jgi:hypothetical protein
VSLSPVRLREDVRGIVCELWLSILAIFARMVRRENQLFWVGSDLAEFLFLPCAKTRLVRLHVVGRCPGQVAGAEPAELTRLSRKPRDDVRRIQKPLGLELRATIGIGAER